MELISRYEYEKQKANYMFWRDIVKKLTFGIIQLSDFEELVDNYIVVDL